MTTYNLKGAVLSKAQNGKDFIEFEAGKFAEGDKLVWEFHQKGRRGRKEQHTRYTLEVEGVGEEYRSELCASGSFNAQYYYGKVTIEEI